MDAAERIPIDIGYENASEAEPSPGARVTVREDGTVVFDATIRPPCEIESANGADIVVCAEAPTGAAAMRMPSTADDRAVEIAAAARTPCAGCVVVSGTSIRIGFGEPPPAPLMIDLESIPEAPPGSDAARYAEEQTLAGSDSDRF